jgi:hypothetical protein
VIMFIDDILVYSTNFAKHQENLKTVLNVLKERMLFSKLNKCEFLLEEVSFLGHIVNKNGLAIDPPKVNTVVKWK